MPEEPIDRRDLEAASPEPAEAENDDVVVFLPPDMLKEGGAHDQAVQALLKTRAPEVIAASAMRWTGSPLPYVRANGYDALAGLPFEPDLESYVDVTTLLARVEDESEASVLASGLAALSRCVVEEAGPLLLRHADHADAGVRLAIARGLRKWHGQDAVEALLALAEDREGKVRDWALFSLGNMAELDRRSRKYDLDQDEDRLEPADRERFRATFWAHRDDPDADAQLEAVIGLAHLGDPRAVPMLIAVFEAGETGSGGTEALTALLDPGDTDKALQERIEAATPEERIAMLRERFG